MLGDLLGLQLDYNSGAAFSIGEEHTWVFAVIAGLAAIGVSVAAYRTRTVVWVVVWGLLLGGAATHLSDRLFRAPGFARGHVVDFISYGNWFIGNVADIAIFAGAVMLLTLSLLGISMRAPRPPQPPRYGSPQGSHDGAAAPAPTPLPHSPNTTALAPTRVRARNNED